MFRSYRNSFFAKAVALSLVSTAAVSLTSDDAAAAQGQDRMVVSAVVVSSASANGTSGFSHRGIGLGGFDPVAYRSGRGVKPGRADIETTWDGVTYRFNSELNRNLFLADPKSFLAQFDGHCAWSAAKGRKVAADPSAWVVHDGKIYLFTNQRLKSIWQQDAGANIARAETNWHSIH